jgi:hypothetical protein
MFGRQSNARKDPRNQKSCRVQTIGLPVRPQQISRTQRRHCLLRVSLWNDICDIRRLSSKQGTSLHLPLMLIMHLLKDAPVRDATYRKLFRASPSLSNPALKTPSATVASSDWCRLIVLDYRTDVVELCPLTGQLRSELPLASSFHPG